MTNKEASKVIYEMICLKLLTPQEDEALHIAYRALEDTIPKPPEVELGNLISWYRCPKCKETFAAKDAVGWAFYTLTKNNCCSHCGQEIDLEWWSEGIDAT